MNNMNFFGWIRDGVRQSVLLGVSDAVEQLGAPAATEELHPSVVAFLQRDTGSPVPKLSQGNASGNFNASEPKSRRRLGKSLKDMGNQTPQSS